MSHIQTVLNEIDFGLFVIKEKIIIEIVFFSMLGLQSFSMNYLFSIER